MTETGLVRSFFSTVTTRVFALAGSLLRLLLGRETRDPRLTLGSDRKFLFLPMLSLVCAVAFDVRLAVLLQVPLALWCLVVALLICLPSFRTFTAQISSLATFAALPSPIFKHNQILVFQRVSFATDGFLSINRSRSTAKQDVFLEGHWPKVGRIDASTMRAIGSTCTRKILRVTIVIQGYVSWQWAYQLLIYPTVSSNSGIGGEGESSITCTKKSPGPFPTAIWELVNLRHCSLQGILSSSMTPRKYGLRASVSMKSRVMLAAQALGICRVGTVAADI